MAFLIIKLYQVVFAFGVVIAICLFKWLLHDKGPSKLNFVLYLVGGRECLIHFTTYKRYQGGMVFNFLSNLVSSFLSFLLVYRLYKHFSFQFLLEKMYNKSDHVFVPSTLIFHLPPHQFNSTPFLKFLRKQKVHKTLKAEFYKRKTSIEEIKNEMHKTQNCKS